MFEKIFFTLKQNRRKPQTATAKNKFVCKAQAYCASCSLFRTREVKQDIRETSNKLKKQKACPHTVPWTQITACKRHSEKGAKRERPHHSWHEACRRRTPGRLFAVARRATVVGPRTQNLNSFKKHTGRPCGHPTLRLTLAKHFAPL